MHEHWMEFEWTGTCMAQSIGSIGSMERAWEHGSMGEKERKRDGEINVLMSVHDNPCLVMLGFGVKLVELVE